MSILRHEDGTIVLEGDCPVEDAQLLLQALQAAPTAPLDWRKCVRLHTAVLQIVLAAGATPIGPCGDAWVHRWIVD